MATKPPSVNFSTKKAAANDVFSASETLLTEDSRGVVFLDVVRNDTGSSTSRLYSLDDGVSSGTATRPSDLLVADSARTEEASTDTSANGARIWITSTGKVGYDSATLKDSFRAQLQTLQAGQTLTDTFTYAVRLQDGNISWATASVQFAGVNDAPVAAADTLAANWNTPVTFTSAQLLANDSDVDNPNTDLRISSVTAVSGGTVLLNANGSVTFTPAPGFTGNAAFTYTASDGSAVSSAATVTVVVSATGNVPPVNAVPAAVSVPEDGVLAFTGANGISVSDANHNLASVQLLVGHGQLKVTLSGAAAISSGANNTGALVLTGSQADVNATLASLEYRPASNFNGTDTLTIVSRDSAGTGLTDTDTVSITVAPVNDSPIVAEPIADQSALEDQAFVFQLSAGTFVDVDGDELSYAATLANGDLLPAWLSFDPSTLSFSGTPTESDVGTIAVTVAVKDQPNSTASATFNLSVSGANDAPTLSSFITIDGALEDTPFEVTYAALLEASDAQDADGDPITFEVRFGRDGIIEKWNGSEWRAGTSFSLGEDEILRWTPWPDAHGMSDAFQLKAFDGHGFSEASGRVSIIVGAVNDAPDLTTAIGDQEAMEDTAIHFGVATSFQDRDLDTLRFSATVADGNPLPAWLSLDSVTGDFSGTPGNEDIGTVDIQVTASDGTASVSDTFSITVGPLVAVGLVGVA